METDAQIINVLLYSGILVYLGYQMGKTNRTKVIADTIESLMKTGFIKWYWKGDQKEILKWRDEYPEEKKETDV
jgi:hypothetical protein|tara:strand:+ start:3012 stop:3233 length:222 start_codon:yes stop_codon:yes gene_type:complete